MRWSIQPLELPGSGCAIRRRRSSVSLQRSGLAICTTPNGTAPPQPSLPRGGVHPEGRWRHAERRTIVADEGDDKCGDGEVSDADRGAGGRVEQCERRGGYPERSIADSAAMPVTLAAFVAS